MMVDYWGVDSFSASDRQRMKLVAKKYIENLRLFTMDDAVSLAYSLNERSLIEMASNLINDDAEMVKRKFGNVDRIQKLYHKHWQEHLKNDNMCRMKSDNRNELSPIFFELVDGIYILQII